MYGLMGQREEAQNMYNKVRSLAENCYVDPGGWAWAYLAIGDHDKAYESLTMAAENHALIADPHPIQFMRFNFCADPVLEEPRFVELRQKLKYTQD